MTRKPLHEIGDLQRQVMEILWEQDEASVQRVRELLGGERPPAYTTVLSVLQKLEKAGWVGHKKSGRTYIYAPRHSREEEGRTSLGNYIERVFRGDPLKMFQHLLADERLGDDELAELRRMIDAKREGQD
jgi:BlaI family penicillinase repressor